MLNKSTTDFVVISLSLREIGSMILKEKLFISIVSYMCTIEYHITLPLLNKTILLYYHPYLNDAFFLM